MYKTHHCNELTVLELGQIVTLVGWIDSIRDHGGIYFIDLRDREGITQLTCDTKNAQLASLLEGLRVEFVIQISGCVQKRPENTANALLKTGSIEIQLISLQIHNTAQILPFPLEEEKACKVSEDLRLTYRYLDLRRPRNFQLLKLRHQASQIVRQYLDLNGFLEIELPTLFKSTPEGAREFLVPSRLNPGSFYALSQSPQQYKQILMVAGVERYFSLARCYRDEDLRSDRQLEFTQIDLEASFIDREMIYNLIETLLCKLWKEILDVDVPVPFKRIPYAEAMNRYGSDKPDTRFGIEIQDVSTIFTHSELKVFASIISKGGVVKAINAKGLADLTQGELKNLEVIAKAAGAHGLAYIKLEDGQWKSPLLKFLSESEKANLQAALDIQDTDTIFFAASSSWETACSILGKVRLECAALLKKREYLTIPSDAYHFLWVIDFPLMTRDETDGRYVATHHPFTAPVPEDLELLGTQPHAVRGQHYDIVLNGMELGGGSIRIHQSNIQKYVFESILKIPADVVESRFGYLLKAFTFGAPPHGGIALGLDRICSILGNTNSVREVIAFPKNHKGQDLMAESPTPVTPKQLKELGILTVHASL